MNESMQAEKSARTYRYWPAKNAAGSTYAEERLEWRQGSFWLIHSDRPAGEMLWRDEIGLWQFLPTQGDLGRRRRRRLSAAEGLKWLLIQGYQVTAEPEEFIEELLAQLQPSDRSSVLP